MQTKLNPYVHFKDNAREAMKFYQGVFGGELRMNTFKEYGASQDPSEDNRIMHAELATPNGLTLMAADTPSQMEYRPGDTITLSLSGEKEAELRGYYEKLCVGGQIQQPLEKAPWGDTFGMVTDRYGIEWMVNITEQARG